MLICCVFILGIAPAAGRTQLEPDAEPEEPPRVQFGIGILAGLPEGEFGENIEGAGGFSGHLGVPISDSIFSLGGEAAYLWYGEESRQVPWSTTIPDVLLTVRTNNAMFLMHGRARAQARQGRWRPYVDGLLGFTDIFTKTSVEGLSLCQATFVDCDITTSTNLRDFAFSYGGGAGVMVGFGSSPVRLDLSLRYVRGSEADYLREGAISREGGQATLDISRSRTDMFLLYIGAAFGR